MLYILSFLEQCLKPIKNILFVFDITFVFLYEYSRFLITENYKELIHNVSSKLSKKNVLYVKMFQAISLNNNIIDGAINSELIKYTDSAPYTEDDIDESLLRHITIRYYLESYNDTIPIKSGMISLVYKMRDSNGNDLIIKMKRKNIEARLDDAIEKLLFFIYVLSFIPQFNVLDIPNVIKQNIYLLRQQLDFQEEVKNTLEMSENCKKLKYIKIPKIYEAVTNEFPDVIMMEYIEGTHISKLCESDYSEFAKLVMKYGFVSIINNSVTHGDLHAGNIIFIKNHKSYENPFPQYQLGLIDFGIITRINGKTTNAFLETVTKMFSESGRVLAETILDSIIEPLEKFKSMHSIHRDKLYNHAGIIIEDVVYKSKQANQVKIYDFMKKFNEYINNNNLSIYGLHISDDFIKLQMALAMSQGVALCLCKQNFMLFANDVLNDLFHIDLLFTDSE